MGKSKSRIFRKGINNQITKMSRNDAVKIAVKNLNENNFAQAKDIITMFGLNAEDLLEGGASYESVKTIRNIL